MGKTASGTGTVYAYDEAGHLVGEYDAATGNPIQETIWMGDTPIAVVKGSGTYYVHADHLNTPRQINNQAGDAVWVWDTITFGSSSPDEDPLATGTPFTYNLRHPGQYYEAESGLFQNWHRDYSPNLGRYVESDPIGLVGGINTYAYVFQNPLIFTDPQGLEVVALPSWVLPAVRHGAGGVATTMAAILSMPGDTNQQRIYATYTRTNPATGETYCGRTSGYETPEELVRLRGLGQPELTAQGFLPPVLDRFSENYDAIRGREQNLIDFYGGAQSVGGSAKNGINGVSDYNPNGFFYIPAAAIEFGSLPDNSPDRFRIWNW